MISGKEIWTAANQLVKQHGADAAEAATKRAKELALKGDEVGERVFLEIRNAVEWLLDTRGRDPFKVEH